jgi:hypothetical protein
METKVIFLVGNTSKAFPGISSVDGKYGFVFPNKSEDLFQTIAHELAHLLGIKRHQTLPERKKYLLYIRTPGGTQMGAEEWGIIQK